MAEKSVFCLGIFLCALLFCLTDGKRSQEDCETGWDSFKDKCYYAYKFPMYTYDEARTVCIALGGRLAKINDVQEDLYLKGYTEGRVHMWLGANDLEVEGNWQWEDGTSVRYRNWYPGQPDNNADGGEHCMHFLHNHHGTWNDGRCDLWNGFICEKEKSLPADESACTVDPVGLESGDIPNSQITASSHHSPNHMPHQGRLNYAGAGSHSWCVLQNVVGEWLQINLGYERTVTRVATQGRGDYDQWVDTYNVRYHHDGAWDYVGDDNGMRKAFQGNSDRNTIVYHEMVEKSFITQYVRFYPLSWHGHMSMRVEVYACE